MTTPAGLTRHDIARRAAKDLPDSSYVNLGVGIPTLVAGMPTPDREIFFHSENGVLGMGPPPPAGEEDPNLINASRSPITLLPGASIFHHTDAFIMIRGGHIDVALLGAFQVSVSGDLANWTTREAIPGVGGAMDLAAGAKQVRVLMEHTTRDGAPKIVERCTYPLTAPSVVRRIYTDLAVMDVVPEGLVVRELAPGVEFDDVCSRTGCRLTLAPDWRRIALS